VHRLVREIQLFGTPGFHIGFMFHNSFVEVLYKVMSAS
jgi:hypothetical protein